MDIDRDSDVVLVLAWIGFATVVVTIITIPYHVLKWLYKTCKPAAKFRDQGRWACITGGTDGIGKAFANHLASIGMDLMIISRDQNKLNMVAKQIEQEHKVRVKTLEVDFTKHYKEYMHRIESFASTREIGVLVNNVGMGYVHPEEYLKIENGMSAVEAMINCNIMSVNVMIQCVLPQMVSRRRGVVLNVSGLSAMISTPLLSVYSGTKAYVRNFTRDLKTEYGNRGIIIMCLLPGYVVTKHSGIQKSGMLYPTPDKFVKSALQRVGVLSETPGYWAHDVIVRMLNIMPTWVRVSLMYKNLSSVKDKAFRDGGDEYKLLDP